MSEKLKSFFQFLNESSRTGLPSPEHVESLNECKEIEKIFLDSIVYGGGKQPTRSLVLEGKEEDEKVEAFNKALNSPEGKDFQRWFDIKRVRTGRTYIHKKNEIKRIYIPSKSYIDLSGFPGGGKWYYEFSSSNGTYGRTDNQDLKSLFREFMVDAVRKSRPSAITEKQIKEFFSKESNFPKGSFPDPEKIYSSIIGESGLITDFSFLMDLPIIKRISDLGVPVSIKKDSGLTSVYVDFSSYETSEKALTSIFGKKYTDSLKEVIKEIPWSGGARWEIILFGSIDLFSIDPKSKPGKNVYRGRTHKELRLGFDSKEKIEKYTEDFIKEEISLITTRFKKQWNESILISPLEDLIKKSILGESIGDLKKKSEERIEEILLEIIGPHIKENPIDLYILDGMPNLKKKVMEKYKIEKDFSKLGRVLKTGFL